MNLLKAFAISAVLVFGFIGCGEENPVTATPDYTLQVPNGGETYKIGDTVSVSWLQSSKVNGTLIYISVNNGKVWNQIVTIQVPKSSTTYKWVISANDLNGVTPPVQALIKISNYTDETLQDVSNNPFTITE